MTEEKNEFRQEEEAPYEDNFLEEAAEEMLEEISQEEKMRRDRIFEEELMPHADALYNFAFHLSHDEINSDDLVQETYFKAYRFIQNYEPGTNAKAWLFTILRNAFINEYRRRNRKGQTVELEDHIVFGDSDEDANLTGFFDLRTEVFENIIGDEIQNAINSLNEKFRMVIILCDIEDFTYEEISKIISVPIGTVRSRLFRARNELKEKLKAYAYQQGYKDVRGNK